MTSVTELSVNGITVESLYNNYASNKYRINRRYQRKLVWNVEDKQRLVESIFRSYPIPLLLFADIKTPHDRYFEVIDGMQRINAIIYFIENRISCGERFFDLESLSATKLLKDAGTLVQRKPIFSREECLRFTQYIVPSSVYEFDTPQQVDEVFKRINSMGRYLSRQELRVAGANGEFPTLVRKISANIRGDSSQSDIFSLDKMPFISLAFSDEDLGIKVSEIFWIKHGIITKEMLRESRDEEIVCDLIASTSLHEMPPSSSEIFNEFYGYPSSTSRSSEINAAIARVGAEQVEMQILETLDEFTKIFDSLGSTFVSQCFSAPPARAPRYFTAFFIALLNLAFKKNRRITDFVGVKRSLQNVCDSLDVGTGGNWSAANRERCVNSLIGILDPHCEDVDANDPSVTNWNTRIDNILNQSLIEQQLYDFKIGVTDLSPSGAFSNPTISKITSTLIAMANDGPSSIGYVLVGIADTKADADRVKDLYSHEYVSRHGKCITGVEHDCVCLGLSEDQLFSKICSAIDREPIDSNTLREIKANIRPVAYQGKSLIVAHLKGSAEPRLYNGKYFVRDGTSNKELEMSEVQWLFARFRK
ncbi:DUF262 domain-containing protein [Synechococcus sp. Lug-A]|uniref:GmrSD restriction endonuclease domain-containing protein n=1 Tax=Synechococcus sp. Lug-A TaxID=2823740 RepID=UPI0020CD3CD7|nr:DUF262 domain-containing protein [Synechococcus sp. Lug-A]MCP9848001.1 DUF262 domain-containing protein [Synechococcus sp. Lug-A]